jgi:hypothetical protein
MCRLFRRDARYLKQPAFSRNRAHFGPETFNLRHYGAGNFAIFALSMHNLQSPAGRADMNVLLIMRFPAVMPIKATWRR